jgi:hypothetical protein
MRFVVSVALTCTGRPAGWVPGRVGGAEPPTLVLLQVRRVRPAAPVTGRQCQKARVTYPGGLASGGHPGNGQLSGLMTRQSASAPGRIFEPAHTAPEAISTCNPDLH